MTQATPSDRAIMPYKSPGQAIKRHGGKTYLAKRIIDLMPRHVVYSEAFCGTCAVLLARDPQDPRFFYSDRPDHRGVSEVVNDLDGRLTNFWRVLQDESLFAQFQRRVEAMPLSRVEFDHAGEHEYGTDLVKDAAAFFVRNRQSRQALEKDYVTPVSSRLRRGRNEQVSSWQTAVDGLVAFHERLIRVEIENRPALGVIQQRDAPSTLFYLDPPYPQESRTARTAYGQFEMTTADHRELLDTLRQVKGKVMLSSYPNELYDTILSSWTRHTFDIANHAAGGETKDRETEVLWCNF